MRTALLALACALAAPAPGSDSEPIDLARKSLRDANDARAAVDALGRFSAGSPAERSELDADARELIGLLDELDPLLEELVAIEQGYLFEGSLPDGGTRRAEVAAKLKSLLSRVEGRADALKAFSDRLILQKVASAFARARGARGLGDARGEAGDAMLLQNAARDLQGLKKGLRHALEAESDAYLAYGRERAKRRLLWLVGALLAVAILAGLAASFFYGRKEVSAAPTLAPAGPAVSGPVAAGPAAAPAAYPEDGRELIGGNFRVERELGEGGMGVVYEAFDLTLRRKVAIKRLKSAVVENKRELEMFLAEARLVAALKHPNLVEIHSIVREEGRLFLVFEFVDGKALHQVLEEEERLPLARARALLGQAARGLDYAHAKKVIHRDLKPSNMMLAANGELKLMDFGIAHQAKKTVARMTNAAAWGTPPYMAPEQELGSVLRESDLYALGVCCYELLAGRLPFEGPDFLAQKRAADFPPPSALGLPAALDPVLARALDPNPARRFHSAAELAAALDAVPA